MCCWRRTTPGGTIMSRVQLALNVADLDASIEFYTKLFQTPPAKIREGYANFAIADPPLKLVLFTGMGEPGLAQPRRRRGRIDRRGDGRDRPHAGRSVWSRKSRRTRRVASPCRTRRGSRVPRTTGSSTPCSATRRRWRAGSPPPPRVGRRTKRRHQSRRRPPAARELGHGRLVGVSKATPSDRRAGLTPRRVPHSALTQ